VRCGGGGADVAARALAGIPPRGGWRFIEAKPAPWAKPHRLSKAEAPLLEFGVDFVEGGVKGPPPLACASAKYSLGETYLGEAFGGRLVGDNRAAMAKQARLGDSGLTTFRVVCGEVVRDFYIDERADLVMAEGNVLRTLERPTGMDPQHFTAGSAPAGHEARVDRWPRIAHPRYART